MEKRFMFYLAIFLFAVCCVLGGWLYFILTTDGEFEQAYSDAQARIYRLEEQLGRSRSDIELLREENQRVRTYADEVEGDRIKLAEVNRQLEIFLGQLRADNRRLARAITESRNRTEIIASGLEDLEKLLQEIEGKQNQD